MTIVQGRVIDNELLTTFDVDGVLADFIKGACAVHGHPDHVVRSWDWYKSDWGITDEEFWAPIYECEDFYGDHVPKYSWADELVSVAAEYGPIVYATVNPLHDKLSASKTRWIRNNLGDQRPVFTVYEGPRGPNRRGKELLAAPNSVLIDDADANIEKWVKRGGRGILFPQLWNKEADLKEAEGVGYDPIWYVNNLLAGNAQAILL